MNSETTRIRTAAETGLADAFASLKARLPGGRDVAARREAAFRRFEAAGLPHRRIEAWKYTDLRSLMRDAKPLAGPARVDPEELAALLPGIDACRIAIVNGTYAPAASHTIADPGVEVMELFAGLAGQPARQDPAEEQDVALALNAAFMSGGVVLRVRKGARIDKPIHLAHVFSGDVPAAMYPRTVVVVEPGAQVTLIETFDGPDGPDYQVNTALELTIGERARFERVKIGRDGPAALHISTVIASVGAHAHYSDFAFTTGSSVTRNQLFLQCAGEGAKLRIAGATLTRARQHIDTTLVVDHAAQGCESREIFKSVLDDESRAVFQGKIVVRPRAQKTDGRMMTQALLLSDLAEADNKPELEIFADDVQCGHGATSGRLDDSLLFYLMARGIPAKEAEALLIQAFVGEAVEGIAYAPLRENLMDCVETWLKGRT